MAAAATRWEPDAQLIPAVLASSRSHPMSSLSAMDRSWVVAGLARHGMTSEDIADRLGCSLRLVKTLRTDPMTLACLYAQRETEHFRDELQLIQSEHRHTLTENARLTQEVARLRAQVSRLIDRDRQCPNGHAMTPYNTYERNGRRWCRECHRVRQASYRARRSRRVA